MESFMEEMVMNRFEYLGALSNCIQHELPADEYNNVMQYYSEYFADAGIEKEQEVIQELGAPSELARRIIAEYRGRQPGEVKLNAKKKFPVGWIIFIAVAGSPIWLALLCVAIGVAAAVAAVAVSVVAVAVAFLIGGVACVLGGIIEAFANGANGMLAVGIGCLCTGAGVLLSMLCVLIIRSIVKGCKSAAARRRKKKYAAFAGTEN